MRDSSSPRSGRNLNLPLRPSADPDAVMARPPSRILVPTDLSETSAHALRYACVLAARFDAVLLLVHARELIAPIDFGAPMTPMVLTADEDLAELAREELLEFAETHIPTEIPFEIAVVDDSPVNSIIAHSTKRDADLIVIGTHGRTGFRRLVLGSVTEAVMRRAPVPVVACGPGTPAGDISRIACYIEDAGAAKNVIEAAAALAGDATEFVILTTCDGTTRAKTADELMRIRAAMPAKVLRRAHIMLLDGQNLADEVTISARAMRADLIALATPARHDPFDVLRGTTVERIVQQSSCPVLVCGAGAITVECDAWDAASSLASRS